MASPGLNVPDCGKSEVAGATGAMTTRGSDGPHTRIWRRLKHESTADGTRLCGGDCAVHGLWREHWSEGHLSRQHDRQLVRWRSGTWAGAANTTAGRGDGRPPGCWGRIPEDY